MLRALLFVTAVALTGCLSELEGTLCNDDGRCIEGFRCDGLVDADAPRGRCRAGEEPPPSETVVVKTGGIRTVGRRTGGAAFLIGNEGLRLGPKTCNAQYCATGGLQ